MGVVEEVGVEGKKAFTNIEELWNILNYKLSGKGGDDRSSFEPEGFGGF